MAIGIRGDVTAAHEISARPRECKVARVTCSAANEHVVALDVVIVVIDQANLMAELMAERPVDIGVAVVPAACHPIICVYKPAAVMADVTELIGANFDQVDSYPFGCSGWRHRINRARQVVIHRGDLAL